MDSKSILAIVGIIAVFSMALGTVVTTTANAVLTQSSSQTITQSTTQTPGGSIFTSNTQSSSAFNCQFFTFMCG